MSYFHLRTTTKSPCTVAPSYSRILPICTGVPWVYPVPGAWQSIKIFCRPRISDLHTRHARMIFIAASRQPFASAEKKPSIQCTCQFTCSPSTDVFVCTQIGLISKRTKWYRSQELTTDVAYWYRPHWHEAIQSNTALRLYYFFI